MRNGSAAGLKEALAGVIAQTPAGVVKFNPVSGAAEDDGCLGGATGKAACTRMMDARGGAVCTHAARGTGRRRARKHAWAAARFGHWAPLPHENCGRGHALVCVHGAMQPWRPRAHACLGEHLRNTARGTRVPVHMHMHTLITGGSATRGPPAYCMRTRHCGIAARGSRLR